MAIPVTPLYVVSSGLLAAAGLVMVGMAVRAYRRSGWRPMLHLSIGFTIVVAATVGTAIATFVGAGSSPRTILLVNNGLTSVGYLFVVYSLVDYD